MVQWLKRKIRRALADVGKIEAHIRELYPAVLHISIMQVLSQQIGGFLAKADT